MILGKDKIISKKPPVIILDGIQNAFSIARSLGRRGIKIYMSTHKDEVAQYSRYIYQNYSYDNTDNVHEFWRDLLLRKNSYSLHGSIVLPCGDDAVEFVSLNEKELRNMYILDDFVPEIHLAMLDKKKTLQMAKSLNIPIPNYWEVEKMDDLEKLRYDISFPAIIKPIHSHLFNKQFPGRKYLYSEDFKRLLDNAMMALSKNLKIMVCELIPGPDSLLGSYYSYFDSNGKPLFHFTKKIIRRFPKNQGPACYHKTEWDKEIADLGLKFFKGINYRGLGNIEFKRDLRDGRLKVIECNPRFTAAQELLTRSGIDVALIIYNHLTCYPVPEINFYKQDLRLWSPGKDFKAFMELKRGDEITLLNWLSSLLHKQVFPYFRLTDPFPALKMSLIWLKVFIKKRIKFKK